MKIVEPVLLNIDKPGKKDNCNVFPDFRQIMVLAEPLRVSPLIKVRNGQGFYYVIIVFGRLPDGAH